MYIAPLKLVFTSSIHGWDQAVEPVGSNQNGLH